MRSKICIKFNIITKAMEIAQIVIRGEFLKFEDRDEYVAADYDNV